MKPTLVSLFVLAAAAGANATEPEAGGGGR